MNHIVTNAPGFPRMIDALRDGLRNSNEIAFSVSFLRCSGLGLLIDDLKEFSNRGGRAKILTSTYLGITQPDALRVLISLRGVECRVQLAGICKLNTQKSVTGFHTKLYIFRDENVTCWVGSSNFTKGGLASNIEANLRQIESDVTSEVQAAFDLLWNRNDVVPLSRRILIANATGVKLVKILSVKFGWG